MARTPLDKHPQRQLLDLLRVEVDRVWQRNDKRAWRRLRALVEANPRSVHSTHVAYNLGRARYQWICAHIEADAHAHAHARARAAASSQATRGRSWAEIESWFVTD